MNPFIRGGTVLLLLGDVVTFVGALVLTLLIRYQEFPSDDIIEEHLRPFTFIFIFWVVNFLITGLYDKHISLVRRSIPLQVLKVQFINVLFAGIIFFLLPLGIAPKTNLAIYLVVSTVLIVVWRLYVFPLIVTGKPMSVLVVGSSPEALGIARVLAANPFFKKMSPYLLSKTDFTDFAEFQNSFRTFMQKNHAEIIIADMRDAYATQLTEDFFKLSFEDRNVQFFNLPMIYEQLHHRVPPILVEETWLLENVTTNTPHHIYNFFKRIIDIFGALFLLVPASLVFPCIILAIKLQDRGPIFYVADRVGQYNVPFKLYKFRTMTGRDTGDAALKSELVVTKVGAFLRKTRLDELPQLINILRGDLSFIGPRPELPALAEVYAEKIPYYNMRHLVKPGLSGWAQINNFDVPRQGVDIERTIDKLSFDLYYLKHHSLLLDIEIALKTINTLILRSGT